MLFELIVICTLGAVIYCVPRRKWHYIGITLLYMIKYHILGTLSVMDDLWNVRRNKIDLTLMPAKVAIVTGGSRGIGAMVVKKLLQCDMEVIIACRTIVAGQKTVLQIRKSGVTNGRAKVYELDNSSLESVKEFAKRIKKEYDKVHILINNAGIMFTPYQQTKNGFEEQWAVNYLSHFLLTSLLLPLLKNAGQLDDCSRIINVTSCAYRLASANFDINCKDYFVTQAAYAQSKLAQVIFTIVLQKLLVDRSLNVRVYSVHPGIVKTGIFSNTFWNKTKLMMIAFKTPEQGAIPIVYAAVNKDIGIKGGLYISNCREHSVLPMALESKIQKQLFDLSLKQAQLNDFFQYI
ncbi:PREDICTED: dehydrogenase/reductase SDR family member on chromosome X-like [Dinoponera quadriceps]|uniref:Dehydrogenase/reductase SDR family member on chromosome X-like n=1 Tax=Dinoponera quadriceps TaxID=609295 RepID=A0A6P3YE64_DINQU|nr:PREDICTED: dehydrogenase/reductase SDR family member on chromosome X-like [Dinoponera quadriceps]XP_014489389.1 PREDICTED: dehydrogenase/reductase SDR family member on chromosome X-like [Dinoponera quadriceps]XP_014489390.1 PREDICTED: dehydrogenase/reductase SDR family member on chromosome X-like [Dinoponera quadriceps]XP_014489391.1 PREDICTED: dehydrogenase/reductase SDR family member on chromosome X-like [Dinoponera quadriceps]XP_014489392.1 PREDICTED: dehydrogenase/reductase SDR family me